jgi:methionyl-tRNA formyltransferase
LNHSDARLRAVFAGTPQFALPALQGLAAHCDVAGVLTQPDRPAGRGRVLTASPVKDLALSLHLPVAQPQTLRDAAAVDALRAWQPDIMVVVAYGLLLPADVLALPRLGCLNIHASLLPRWRGAAPIQRAIFAGDAMTGVSIMQMDAGLDTGPVLLSAPLAIGTQTAAELSQQLADAGAALLIQAIDALAAGRLHAKPQAASGVTYAQKLAKSEAQVDWTRTAAQLERQVLAFNPWPVAQTSWRGQPLRLWRAVQVSREGGAAPPGTVLGMEEDLLLVACGQGVLGLRELQMAGRRVVSAVDFANAQSPLGARFES